MNKKQKWICAALAAAMIGTGSAASAAAGSVVWVLAGTAAQADGSAVRIAVPDRRAPAQETDSMTEAAPAASEAAAPAAEGVPAETVSMPSPEETGSPAGMETQQSAPAKAAAAETETISAVSETASNPMSGPAAAAQGTAGSTAAADSALTKPESAAPQEETAVQKAETPSLQEDAMTALADAQRADMDQRKLAALQQAQAAQAAAPAEPADDGEAALSQEEAAPAAEAEETSDDAVENEEQPASGDAEDEETEAGASISPENPMVVKADAMAYRGLTGDVDVRGRVDITHMQDRYQTEHVYGNSNTQQYIIPGKVRWTNPGNNMTAESGTYDGKTTIATFEGIKGWSEDKYYYEGSSGVYNRTENKAVVQKGFLTTKHAVAKVPDYRIEADSIDIYPGNRYEAHNARLYIKNTKILSMSSYSGSLDRDGNAVNLWTLIPVPDYESGNGIGLKNRIEIPVGGPESDLAFYARLAWYSQEGFKPDVGFQWETAPGTFKLRYAKEESTVNDDHIWIEMWPSLSFDSRHFYIPHTDFYVGASGDIGRWKEGSISGSHKQWDVYLSHTPITLGPHLDFSWRVGYMKDYYGYDDSTRSNQYYSLGLDGKFGIWSPWIHYQDNDLNGDTPYEYDTYDMEKPVYTGIRVQMTPLDALSVEYAIDTIDGHTEHKYFTYYRDLHSFTSWIRYDSVDDDFEFMIQPKDFSF